MGSRQNLRVAVSYHARLFVQRHYRRGRSTAGGNPHEIAPCIQHRDDIVIVAPTRASRVGRVGQCYWGTAQDRDFFELAIGDREEANPLAIRRKEGGAWALGA